MCRLSFSLGDIGDSPRPRLCDNEVLRFLLTFDHFVNVSDDAPHILVVVPVGEHSFLQRLGPVPRAAHAVQAVLCEHAFGAWIAFDQFGDERRSVDRILRTLILRFLLDARTCFWHDASIPIERSIVLSLFRTLIPVRPFLRIFLLVALPLVTFFTGAQLGVQYERQTLAAEHDRLEQLLDAGSGTQNVDADPEKTVNIELLWSVWRVLQKNYIDPAKLDPRTLVFGAVSGLVAAVDDPYTAFMTPADSKAFEDVMDGTLEGIGAQLEMKDGHVTVVAPLKKSPAERAGLMPHDIILKVNDADVAGMRLDEVVALIRGKRGTFVQLTIFRLSASEPITFSVKRESIHIPTVESKTIDSTIGPIGYIALNQFGTDTTPEMLKAIDALRDKKIRGMILDLRFNGGGYLEGAVDVVSMFVREGTVATVISRDHEPETHVVHGDPVLPDIPLVVLINEGSASASEIVAGALHDMKRAKVIGAVSFGKGTVQQVIDLPGGSALRVTVAKWLTPSGHDLGKKGLTPDIIVPRTLEQVKNGEDPQLDSAVDWLKSHASL